MSDFEDRLARQRAGWDQQQMMLKDMSPVLVNFYRALCDNGLSPHHAIRIVLDYHHCFWMSVYGMGK